MTDRRPKSDEEIWHQYAQYALMGETMARNRLINDANGRKQLIVPNVVATADDMLAAHQERWPRRKTTTGPKRRPK